MDTHALLIGLAVDYLSRFVFGAPVEKAFDISLIDAPYINGLDYTHKLLNVISGLDDKSIGNACQLAGYDVAYRADIAAYKPVKDMKPDVSIIFNLKTMGEQNSV